jgi:hypothetical protein
MAEELSYVDAVRAEIDKQLGWTPQQVHAEAWDHAVTIAMGVVGPILESWEQRLGDVREEYRKSLESWDRSRKRLDATIQELRAGWRDADQQHARDVELLLWLHAEAVHEAADLDDRRARWALEHQKRSEELERSEASRQAWAEEAMRMDSLRGADGTGRRHARRPVAVRRTPATSPTAPALNFRSDAAPGSRPMRWPGIAVGRYASSRCPASTPSIRPISRRASGPTRWPRSSCVSGWNQS